MAIGAAQYDGFVGVHCLAIGFRMARHAASGFLVGVVPILKRRRRRSRNVFAFDRFLFVAGECYLETGQGHNDRHSGENWNPVFNTWCGQQG